MDDDDAIRYRLGFREIHKSHWPLNRIQEKKDKFFKILHSQPVLRQNLFSIFGGARFVLLPLARVFLTLLLLLKVAADSRSVQARRS